jgi:hypothetical protein
MIKSEWAKVGQLARLKIEEISVPFFEEIYRKCKEVSETQQTGTHSNLSDLEIWLYRFDEWIKKVCQIYQDVLALYLLEKSPEMVRRIVLKGILPAISEFYREYGRHHYDENENVQGQLSLGLGSEHNMIRNHGKEITVIWARRLEIQALELEAKLPNSKNEIELDSNGIRIRIGKKWHDITDKQHEMLKILLKARGEWVIGKIIGGRPDKLRKTCLSKWLLLLGTAQGLHDPEPL